MVGRLKHEVDQPAEAPPLGAASAAGTGGVAPAEPAGAAAGAATAGPSTSAEGASGSGGGSGGSAAQQKVVPYARRLLLKSLLRAIAIAMYAPGSTHRVDERDAAALYECLKVGRGTVAGVLCLLTGRQSVPLFLQPAATAAAGLRCQGPCNATPPLMLPPAPHCSLFPAHQVIFGRAKEFGGGLYALAASVVADLIHHDPLCYRTLDAAGLPQVGWRERAGDGRV